MYNLLSSLGVLFEKIAETAACWSVELDLINISVRKRIYLFKNTKF